MSINEQVGELVWKFIDRMEDYCDEDPAENILDDFTEAMRPFVLAKVDEFWKQEYGYTYTQFRKGRDLKC